MPLLERRDSVLIVIDLQPRFWGDRLDAGDAARAVSAEARAAWLAATARALDIPMIITEESPDRNGPTSEAVMAVVPRGTPVFMKAVFGLTACPDIMAAIEATERRTAAIVGFETDVCVTHSAIGLLDAGYRVAVAADAVYSPFGAHEYGLSRMGAVGVELMHCKGVYYEWVRTLDEALKFERTQPELAQPPGFSL